MYQHVVEEVWEVDYASTLRGFKDSYSASQGGFCVLTYVLKSKLCIRLIQALFCVVVKRRYDLSGSLAAL
jgi:hypothetical protein